MLEVFDIILLMLRLHMAFRIAGSADTEISLLSDILYQLACIAVMAGQGKLALCRNVSPERQNIFNLILLQLAYDPVYLLFCGRYTGQVCQTGNIKIILNVL